MKRSQLEQLIQDEIKRVLEEEDMDETIKKVGDEYAVYPEKGGKRLGTHKTRKAAEKQLTAIHIQKHKK